MTHIMAAIDSSSISNTSNSCKPLWAPFLPWGYKNYILIKHIELKKYISHKENRLYFLPTNLNIFNLVSWTSFILVLKRSPLSFLMCFLKNWLCVYVCVDTNVRALGGWVKLGSSAAGVKALWAGMWVLGADLRFSAAAVSVLIVRVGSLASSWFILVGFWHFLV